MHAGPSSRITLVFLCLLSVAVAVQAQSAPIFTPGTQVSTTAQALKVLAADVNNDGHADLISLESNSTTTSIQIYISNGDGTFRAPFPVVEGTLHDFAIGDFDQDGNLDLVVSSPTNTGNGVVSVFFGNGQGSFGGAQSLTVADEGGGIAVGDFNNDGRMDIAVLGARSKSVTILTNTGTSFTSSSFTVPTHFDTANPGFAPDILTGIVAGDFNGDGKMDLLYQDSCGASCDVSQEAYFLLTNSGSGFTATLANFASTGAGAMHTLDLDYDGRADVYFAFHGCHTPCTGVTVAYSNGDGTFQTVDPFSDSTVGGGNPIEVIAGDFNDDGIMDIAAVSSSRFSGNSNVNPGLDIYLGSGGRTFAATPVHFDSPNGASASPFRIAAGFVDHDGQKDILMVENGDFIPFLNHTNSTNDPCIFSFANDAPAVNICVPAAGGTVTSPVHFVGSFRAPTQPANRIELWIDGKKQFQVFNDRIDISLNVAPGAHSAALVGVSATGQFVSNTRSFTVQSGCPVPSTATVSICSPTAGSSVASPVHIAASARAAAGRTLTAMRIYIDNVAQQTVSGNTISADLTVPAGSHLLAVVGYDNTGAAEKTTETFTVTGGTAGPCLPSAPGAKICTPTPGATVTSPVEVSAGAVPTAQKITAIRVYVDNVAVFFSSNTGTSSSFSIDQKLTMAAGTHNLVVVAYQDDGSALTPHETITVH